MAVREVQSPFQGDCSQFLTLDWLTASAIASKAFREAVRSFGWSLFVVMVEKSRGMRPPAMTGATNAIPPISAGQRRVRETSKFVLTYCETADKSHGLKAYYA